MPGNASELDQPGSQRAEALGRKARLKADEEMAGDAPGAGAQSVRSGRPSVKASQQAK